MDRHVYGVLLALAAWTSLAAGDAEAQIVLLPAGAPLNKPQVLFPKIDKDELAALAALHLEGDVL